MTSRRGLLALVSIAAIAAGSFTVPAAPGAADTWKLSLRDAVALALERNLDLAVGRIAPALAQEEIAIARSAFDPTVTGGVNHDESKEEPTSDFSRQGSTLDQFQVRFDDPNMTGGQFQAAMSYRDSSDQYTPETISRFNIVPTSQQATLALTYSQSLLRNLGLSINRTSIEQARISRQISEQQLQATMLSVVEQTIQAYWNMVGAEQSLEVARESLRLARDFLDQTRIKVEVGTLAPIEVTTAEAEVASREEAVILAETELERTRDVLRQLIRVPDGSPNWLRPIEPLDEPGFAPRKVDVDRAIATALERRPDVAEVDLRLRNTELTTRFRRNQLRPDLKLTGTYSATGNSFDYLPQTVTQQVFDPGPDGIPGTPDDVGFVTQQVERFFPQDQGSSEAFREIPDLDNTFWTVRLDLTIPLRNRRARAEFARARLGVEQARLTAEATRLRARVEVRDAVRNLHAAARRVDSARANLVLQRKKLEAEQKRYENGLSTAFQVLTFQNDLREAEQREIQAIIDYNNAEVTLERVQATLLDELGIVQE